MIWRGAVLMDRVACEWCKTENEANSMHCSQCGAPLFSKDRISEPASMPPPPPSYSYQPPPRTGWSSGYRPWRWTWLFAIFPLLFIGVGVYSNLPAWKHHSSISSATPMIATPQPPAHPPPQLFTGDGLTGLLAGMRTKFGDTTGYSLSVRHDRAQLYRADSAHPHKIDNWAYGSTGWSNDAEESSTEPPVEFEVFPWDDTALGDLGKFDVQAVLGVVREAPQTLHIDTPTDTSLNVDSLKDGSLGLRIQVTGDSNDTGTILLSADGKVSKVEPPS
jgi:hypothetical protein